MPISQFNFAIYQNIKLHNLLLDGNNWFKEQSTQNFLDPEPFFSNKKSTPAYFNFLNSSGFI